MQQADKATTVYRTVIMSSIPSFRAGSYTCVRVRVLVLYDPGLLKSSGISEISNPNDELAFNRCR